MADKTRKDNIRRANMSVNCSVCGESVPPKGRMSVPAVSSGKAEFAHEKCYMRKYMKLRPDGKGGWETVTARGVLADNKRRERAGKMPVIYWLVPLVFLCVSVAVIALAAGRLLTDNDLSVSDDLPVVEKDDGGFNVLEFWLEAYREAGDDI